MKCSLYFRYWQKRICMAFVCFPMVLNDEIDWQAALVTSAMFSAKRIFTERYAKVMILL